MWPVARTLSLTGASSRERQRRAARPSRLVAWLVQSPRLPHRVAIFSIGLSYEALERRCKGWFIAPTGEAPHRLRPTTIAIHLGGATITPHRSSHRWKPGLTGLVVFIVSGPGI